MILTLCLTLALLAAPSLEQNAEDPSPCPYVFMYGPSRAKPGRWYGTINLSTDNTLHSLWLNVILDNEAEVLGNSIGNVTTHDNKNFQIENPTTKISPGHAMPVYFYVQYNPQSTTPRLLAIRLNGKEICNFIIKYPVKKPFIPPRKPIVLSDTNDKTGEATIDTQNQQNTNPQGQGQCGKVKSNPILQVGNSPAMEEQWPWQIALYRTQIVDNKYICGGTLVAARHVITAAHCVTRKSNKLVVDRHTLTVYLGKQNLRTSVDGVQISSVKDIIVHPDYNPSIFSRDVAILELSQPLKYTDWVRPACLWPQYDADLKKLVGMKGTLVGWVFDDAGPVVNDLVMETMPVVNHDTCINSYNDFFSRFTSEHTYCAGNRNDISSCPSAGSGMVFRNGDAWYLRGLVSLSVPKLNAFQCDPRHYTIFTDLAKFQPWINSIIVSRF